MTSSTALARLERLPAAGTPRGTFVVLGGRGERPAVYQRFADRLAADGYRVVVFGSSAGEGDGAEAATVGAAIGELAANEAGPRLVVASDSGVAVAWRAIADGRLVVDGVVSAGALTGTTADLVAGSDEIAERSACPVHRGRLKADGALERGLLASHSRDDVVDESLASRIRLPALVVHGEDDAISPFPAAVSVYGSLPSADVFGLEGGLHDVLNDVTHRSVAAQIVQFAERLRTPHSGLRAVTTVS